MAEKTWFGLTGGIATGKSTVARLLSDMGAFIIDADKIAKDVVQPESPAYLKIVKHFGNEIINSDGQINRKALGQIIFSDKNQRKKLEEITHPEVRKLSLLKLSKAEADGHFPIFYDVPLLYEAQMQDLFKGVIVVACDNEIQIERLCERDGINKEEAIKKIKTQLPLQKKIEQADFTIWNNGSLEDLKEEASNIMSFLVL